MPRISHKKCTKSSNIDLVLYAITLFAVCYFTIRAFIPFALEMAK